MLKSLMITTAVSGLMIGAAAAQAPQPQQPSPPAATGGAPGAGASSDSQIINTLAPGQWLSSSMIGVDVLGPDDEKIGDVADILFDQRGNVVGYVIGVGGVLGMGTKNVALAPSSLQIIPSSGSMGRTTTGSGAPTEGMKLKTTMSKDQLKAATTFESRGSGASQPATRQ